MRFSIRYLLTALVFCWASSTSWSIDIYVLTNNALVNGSPSTNFGRIDSATGAYTSIASLAGDVGNLAWNPVAGTFFVTAGLNSTTTLRTLTTTGTLSSAIGTIGDEIYGMAYRPTDSMLYAISYNSDATGTIDPSNGIWTQLNASSGLSLGMPSGGRYSILNDTMYLAANYSPVPGIGTMGYTASSSFQSIATNSLYQTIALANDGVNLYGLTGNGTPRIYTIDPGTGSLTSGALISGAGLGSRFHGVGVAIVPVPEPSTYALGVIASGVLGCVARSRKARKA